MGSNPTLSAIKKSAWWRIFFYTGADELSKAIVNPKENKIKHFSVDLGGVEPPLSELIVHQLPGIGPRRRPYYQTNIKFLLTGADL